MDFAMREKLREQRYEKTVIWQKNA